jgi:hypothetical protein
MAPLIPRSELSEIPQVLSNKKFYNQNFRGADFNKRDMRRSTFMYCTFDGADMSEADCTGSEFYGSSFRETNCRATNFKDANLHATLFEPSDCYGMTLTFNCSTFQDVKISRVWWDAFLFCLCGLMIPAKDGEGFDPRSAIINAIGREHFIALAEKFKQRTL